MILCIDFVFEDMMTRQEEEDENEINNKVHIKPNWKRDISSIFLLMVLYLMQGVIIGITVSIPLILQSKGVSWKQQGTFSFVHWPFSIKLLWAPIIDSLYIKRFGRRKTWLLPIQLLIGLIMILLSFYISSLLNTKNILVLTISWIFLYFLTASQDICVDGWALSLLSNENIGWASTCQTVGQTIGIFIGHVLFLTFESIEYSNKYIRKLFSIIEKPSGIISFSNFLLFWGSTFIIITLLIALFKNEKSHKNDEDDDDDNKRTNNYSLVETYLAMFKLFKKPCIRELTFILLTQEIGFAATNFMTNLKLIEMGVKQELLTLMFTPLILIKIFIPLCISHWTSGSKPLSVYIYCYIPRLFTSILIAIFVYVTPVFQPFQWYYYLIANILFGINETFISSMIVAKVAFNAKISDTHIGGTYMTLLATIANMGLSLTRTSLMYAANYLTWKTCIIHKQQNMSCNTDENKNQCISFNNGTCKIEIDAYTII
ncbi:unnamed protein product [Didymodactylos carnosus]|uniref:Acetyl-coenzyme A transporter 1 n=1 Tax=Didymodactylos carnosus TaxID=1234261 RepID=A0A815ER47_9BILA|nr:unnamed protein product [Didymodactylos carnosus]CAF4155874.1 unnamed protein product [Didymodactylos carnosus]